MKSILDYIKEASHYDERVKQCKKIAEWISIKTFPKLDERIKIALDDDWYFAASHVKFSNSDNPLIYVSIIKDDKEYTYFPGKYYGKFHSFNKDDSKYKYEDVLEEYLNSIKRKNNWYDAYVYDTMSDMKELKYKDEDFKNVEEMTIDDITK